MCMCKRLNTIQVIESLRKPASGNNRQTGIENCSLDKKPSPCHFKRFLNKQYSRRSLQIFAPILYNPVLLEDVHCPFWCLQNFSHASTTYTTKLLIRKQYIRHTSSIVLLHITYIKIKPITTLRWRWVVNSNRLTLLTPLSSRVCNLELAQTSYPSKGHKL